MFLLLPMLLLTTSVQKLVGINLHLPGTSELPPELPGTVEELTVQLGEAWTVQANVRRTDVVTSAGDVEQRSVEVLDLAALQVELRGLKALDPDRERILLVPSDDVPSDRVIATMDALRSDAEGPLFPQIALGGAP